MNITTCLKESRPSNPFIIGYTARDHLLLDLDDTSLVKASSIARQVMNAYPEVGDCLILLSSPHAYNYKVGYLTGHPITSCERNNYHLVFSGKIGYNKCCRICEDLSVLGVLEASYTWCRQFRGDMTLRVSPSELSTGVKPSPQIVASIRNTKNEKYGDGIERYLNFYRATSSFFRTASQ